MLSPLLVCVSHYIEVKSKAHIGRKHGLNDLKSRSPCIPRLAGFNKGLLRSPGRKAPSLVLENQPVVQSNMEGPISQLLRDEQ